MKTAPVRRFWHGSFITALTALLLGVSAVPAAADEEGDVENFNYESWELSYELDMDGEVAVAHVTEELVAQFPDFDQNRGLVRALPLRYQDAPAAPEHITVTDETGTEVPFETETENGMQMILIGDDDYVHGRQTYQLSYTVQNVVHSPDDADMDEFYWDLVPSERAQQIDSASAQIALSPEFAEAFTGEASCYMGIEGSSAPCQIDAGGSDSSTTVTVPAVSLGADEGLTVGLGFEDGTVPQPPERQQNWVLDALPIVLALLSAGLSAAALVAVARMTHQRRQDTGNILTRYGVPDDVPMFIAGPVAGASGSTVTAEILRLAVRGVIRIEDSDETREVSSRTAQPKLRLLDPAAAADPMSERLLTELFPSLQPDATFELPTKGKEKQSFAQSMQKLANAGPKEAKARGLLAKERSSAAAGLGAAALVLAVPVLVLLILGASRDNDATTIIGTLGVLVSLVFGIIAILRHRVHTPEGAALRQQLESVRSTLRSPGKSRDKALRSDEADVVQLYDKALPFAVLYGLEKQWAKVLEATYSDYGIVQPVWYPGLFHDGSGSLEGALSGFTNAMTASSGTSGSSGGGGVGGGGGGGAAGGR